MGVIAYHFHTQTHQDIYIFVSWVGCGGGGGGGCTIFYKRRKEGNVLFNDALNTFYLRLYGVRYMVKDHSDSERGNPLPPHRLLFPLAARVLLYSPSHRQDSTYHGLCYTSRGAMAGTRNSSMGPPHERTLLPWSYISLPFINEDV